MKLQITNFNNTDNTRYDLGDQGLVLVRGESGSGKTTILQGIHFVVTGEGRELVNFSKPKSNMAVTLTLNNGLECGRLKNPVRVKCGDKDGIEAEGMINRAFPDYEDTSYMVDEHDHVLLRGSQADKLAFLTRLTYDVSPGPILAEATFRLKQQSKVLADERAKLEFAQAQVPADAASPGVSVDEATTLLTLATQTEDLERRLKPDAGYDLALAERIDAFYDTGVPREFPDVDRVEPIAGDFACPTRAEILLTKEQETTREQWEQWCAAAGLAPDAHKPDTLKAAYDLSKVKDDYAALLVQRKLREKYGDSVDLQGVRRYEKLVEYGLVSASEEELAALVQTAPSRKRKAELEARLGEDLKASIPKLKKRLECANDSVRPCPWCDRPIEVVGNKFLQTAKPISDPMTPREREACFRLVNDLGEYETLGRMTTPPRFGDVPEKTLQLGVRLLQRGVVVPPTDVPTDAEQALMVRIFSTNLEAVYQQHSWALDVPLVRNIQTMPAYAEPVTPARHLFMRFVRHWWPEGPLPTRAMARAIRENLILQTTADETRMRMARAVSSAEARDLVARATRTRALDLANLAVRTQTDVVRRQMETVAAHGEYLRILQEQESRCLESVLINVNRVLEDVCNDLFAEPMMATIQTTKEMAQGKESRNLVNLNVDFNGYRYKNIQRLSYGQVSRLALALTVAFATISRSPVLLLDETLSRVSEAQREKAFECIKQYLPHKLVIYCAQRETEAPFDRVITL